MIAVGLSAWWPTPSSASAWFSNAEREHAASYHRPLQRARMLRLIGQGFGMAAVWGLAVGEPVASAGWIALLGALAWWVPLTLVEVWSSLHHEPAFSQPAPAWTQIALGSVASLAFHIALFEAIALIVVVARGSALAPAGIGAIGVAAVPMVAFLLGSIVADAIHRSQEIGGAVGEDLSALGARFGLSHVRFMELKNEEMRGPNAFAAGFGRRATISLSPDLLTGEVELRSHVVAHELAHLRRRHGFWAALANAIGGAAVVALSVPIVWSVADGGDRVPMLILVTIVVATPVHLWLSWMSRAHERRADLDAAEMVGTSPDLVRRFHVSDRAVLEPSRIARWFAAHPAPAERLEIVRRMQSRAAR